VPAFDRILESVKQVLLVTEDIKRLSATVQDLAREVREIDRRLVRIETMADIAHAGRRTKQRIQRD
jgi:DNA invertase Pin-like site-specific DNA recombinase